MASFRLGAVGGWAGAALMSLAAVAGAQTNIDSFDDAHPFLGAPPTNGSTEPGTFVIGGERDLQVERISGAGTVGAGVSDNIFTFSAGSLTAGEAQITFDGPDGDAAALAATGLGGVDLTAGGADGLFLNVLTTSAPSVILVEVYTSATRSSLYTLQLPEVIAPTTYALPFAAFQTHLGTGADFSSVGAVVVTLRGTDVNVFLTGVRADVLGGPAVGATMTDALANDVDADTRADSGDTLRYTVTITNSPNAAGATGTELTTNLEPNTALVGGSIQTSPLAIDDYYFSFNPLVIAAPGVLGNDVDADGDAVTVVGGGVPRPTSRGGSVTLNTDGSFSYSPPADGTVDTFTYEVTDGNGITGSGVVTVARLLITPPIVTAAAALAYTENQTATAISPALTVTDADNTNLAGATVQITGNYVSGEDVLGFTDVGAITGAFDAMTGTVTLTGSDTVANYQAALQAVTYLNTSDSPTTTLRTVTWIATDGGSSSDPVTTEITITSANDAPVVTAGGTLAYTENDAAAAIDAGITVSDVDSTNLVGATAQITGGYQIGQDVLSYVTALGISGTFDVPSGTLTLSGTTTVANYQTALQSVRYNNTSDDPNTAARTVTWRVNDGSALNNLSNQPTSTITVAAVNDAPVVTAGGTLAYTENQAAAAIDTGITVSDVDDPNLVGATAQITGGYQNGQDVLSYATALGISGTFDALSGTLTLTGTTTVANYQAALRNVRYNNTSDNPNTAARTVTWRVDDGNALNNLSNQPTSTITVTAVNDAPVVTAGGTLAYTENQAAAAIDTGITVSDVDDPNLVGATAQITGGYQNGQDVLSYATALGISGSFDALSGTLTLTGTTTVANYQAALRNVRYNNTSDDPNTVARTVTWRVDDGSALNNLSNQPTSTITVAAVNDSPVVTTSGGITAFVVAGGPVVVDNALTVTDVDNANLASATVTITNPQDGANEVLAATTCGAFTVTPGLNSLVISGSQPVADYQACLRSVTFNDTAASPNTLPRTIRFVVNDGTSNSANADKLVDAAPRVSTTTPANLAINVAANSNVVVNFSESVTVSGGSFTLECPTGSAQAFGFSGSTTNVSTVTLDPTANLPSGVTCTLTVIASQVTDSDAADGPNNMAADQTFTFGVPPLAGADAYPQTVIGNVNIVSSQIPYSVNSNDVSVLAYNITAFDPTSINGGQVIMTTPSGAGQGQFTYNPPAGFEGNDTFTYTISNAGGSSTATVTIPVAGMIWFVNGAAAITCTTRATGCGRLMSPYSSLDSFRAENNGTPPLNPSSGDNIFVYQNATAYTTTVGLTLLANQKLIGQDATATLAVITGLTPGTGSAPLPTMDTNAPATTISHAGGNQNAITLGLGNTIRGLSVSTGSSSTSGIRGTTVGNFNSADVIVSGSGPAVNINGGNLTASFFSLSSTGGSSGITLNNTTGSFTVTGDGASDPGNTTRGRTTARLGGGTVTLGSGGTITNTTGPAVSLTSATAVTLRNLSLTGNGGGVNSGADGIFALNVTGLTLDNVFITGHLGNDGLSGTAVSGLSLLHTEIHANAKTAGVEALDIWNVRLDNLTGTSAVTNSLFFDALEDIFAITNTGLSNLTLTVTNSEFRDSLSNVTFGMLASGNAVTNLTITGSTFKGAETTGVQYAGNVSSSGTVTVTNNVFGGTAAGGDAGKQNGVDVDISHQGAGTTLNFEVSANTMRQGFEAGTSNSINIFLPGLPSGGTLMTGSVKNNVIGIAGVPNSGSDVGSGIALDATGDGTLTATVTSNIVNEVRAFSGYVFDAAMSDNAKVNLKIRNNTFNGNPAEASSVYGLHINNGTGTSGETGELCMDMGENSVTMPATAVAGVALEVFAGTNTNLIGYGGAANDDVEIQTFLDTTNMIVTPPAFYFSDGGSTQAAVAPCSTFVFPP